MTDHGSPATCSGISLRRRRSSSTASPKLSKSAGCRALPLSDNGAAMTAAEVVEGLARLGILHQTTLPYSAYQNGKQESFWGSVEGRLLAMLEHVPDLTLAFLNDTTLAWVEHEYNRRTHSETGEAPIARFLAGPSVMRPCPDSAALRLAFTRTERRMQRKSDGTIVIEGRRFEVPDRYRHLRELEVRYASWDLALVNLVDERTGNVLCRSGLRRARDELAKEPPAASAAGIAPLLQKLLKQQANIGLPPAYLPKDERPEDEGDAS
jgi:putative transposase